LKVEKLGRGIAWLDTGTHNALLDAGVFVRIIEERRIESLVRREIAWRMDSSMADQHGIWRPRCQERFGEYLLRILRDDLQP